MNSIRILSLQVGSLILLSCLAVITHAQPPAPPTTKPAVLIVHVSPDARLEIQTKRTQQKGATRRFQTKPLDTSKEYDYTLKAVWIENDKEKVREAKVRVRGGEEKVVDIREEETLSAPPELVPEPVPLTPKQVPPPQLPEKTKEDPAPKPVLDKPKADPEPKPIPDKPLAPRLLDPEPPLVSTPKPVGIKLFLPKDPVRLAPGETKPIDIRVERNGYADRISFKLLGLPASVTAQLQVSNPKTATVQIVLSASADAQPEEMTVRLLVIGGPHKDEAVLNILLERI